MTDRSLLPANATDLEREMAALSSAIDRIDPDIIAHVWDAARCPAAILPWLAWSLSVDVWSDEWPEATKRRAISESPAYHRLKGTKAAVDSAAALFGCRTVLTEWWQTSPPSRRGTARLRAYAIERSSPNVPMVTPQLVANVRRAIAIAKPKSRSFTIEVGVGTNGRLGIAAVAECVTVARVSGVASGPRSGLVHTGIVAGVEAVIVAHVSASASHRSFAGYP